MTGWTSDPGDVAAVPHGRERGRGQSALVRPDERGYVERLAR